ncbi:MAG: GntR family transcriptional regulator [Clostridia bacterium]
MLEAQTINRAVPIPLYFQLKELLLREIKQGAYAVDGLIPTEKALALMFGISRTTVRQAITELVQEGWLYRIKSKGTFVARVKIQQDFIKRLETFDEQITRAGLTPSTQVLSFEVLPMPEAIAARFGLTPAAPSIHLDRLRCADGEPIVTVETYLPHPRCAFLLTRDMATASMYESLATHEQTRVCRVTRVVEAVAANEADARLLGIPLGAPIQFFTTLGYNQADELIEFSLARYRGDRNRFEVDLLLDRADAQRD